MSGQPTTSDTAAAVVPTSSGLTTDELALVKCLNQKEAIEYEAQLKKLITKAIKCFQWGQDPEEGDLTHDLVYPTLVHDAKALIKMMNDDVARANQREIVNTVTNADRQCIWDPDIMEDDNDEVEEVQIQEEQGVLAPPDWVEWSKI